MQRDFTDIEFTIVAKADDSAADNVTGRDYAIDVYVFQIVGISDGGAPLWADPSDLNGAVHSVDDSHPYAHGYVLRSGCSHWYFDEQDRLMLHGCERKDLVALGEILARAWDWAMELMGEK